MASQFGMLSESSCAHSTDFMDTHNVSPPGSKQGDFMMAQLAA